MKPRNDVTPTRLLAILGASCIGVGLTGCVEPGWDGPATIVELELIDYDSDGHRLTDPGELEVTAVTNTGNEVSVSVRPECIRELQLGQIITDADLTDQCGDLSASHDD